MSEVTVKHYAATWPLLAASAILAALTIFGGLPAWLSLLPLALVILECVASMPTHIQAKYLGAHGLRVQLRLLRHLQRAGEYASGEGGAG